MSWKDHWAGKRLSLGLGLVMALQGLRAEPSLTALTDGSGELRLLDARLISPDGSFVAGLAGKEGKKGRVAYRWSKDGKVQMLGDLAGGEILAFPTGMSDDGAFVVGFSSSASGTEAFGWTEKSGMKGLGDFPGGEFESQAKGVSADGSVIVGYGTAEGRASSRRHGDAFLWTRAKRLQVLPDIEPFRDTMWANAVSADGSVIVGKGTNAEGRSEAFRWKKGRMEGLGCLLSERVDFYSEAIAVSRDGSLVVGNSGHRNRSREVFLWTEGGGIVALDKLEGEGRSNAVGVSDGGRVLGTTMVGDRFSPFLWDKEGGKVLLLEKLKQLGIDPKDDGWIRLSNVHGISANGRFLVGSGTRRSDGKTGSAGFLIDLGK